LTFGQTDQRISPVTVLQHTALTLSWPEVKVLSYFIHVHLSGHEAQVGRVPLIPDIVLPPSQEPPNGATERQLELWRKMTEAMTNIYEEFMRNNPEAQPR
jgi:hypothetical protein